jgi:hypothetical protein
MYVPTRFQKYVAAHVIFRIRGGLQQCRLPVVNGSARSAPERPLEREKEMVEFMQLLCTPPARDHLAHLEQVHRTLSPLQDIFAGWQHAGASTRSEALALRERQLGPATLSSASLRLLYDISSRYVGELPERICWHAPTLSASETQAVLPPMVLVQKTVTVEMAGQLLLWTGVGEQEHTLEQRRVVASTLGLPRRAAKQCSTNPAACPPEQEFAMLPGMVSPFLPPLHPTRLVAVVLAPLQADWYDPGWVVGVSLSLFESLLLPLHCFRAILRQYAVRAYAPALRWIELSTQALLPAEIAEAA